MFVFLVPLILGTTILGCIVGFVVGRKILGYAGGVLLSMVLGLAPALVGLAIGMWMLWHSNLVP
jgi:hypothetical protein